MKIHKKRRSHVFEKKGARFPNWKHEPAQKLYVKSTQIPTKSNIINESLVNLKLLYYLEGGKNKFKYETNLFLMHTH